MLVDDQASESRAGALRSERARATPFACPDFASDEYRTLFLHIVDRACLGKCLLYSNCEPATRQFRVRVREGSPIVTSNVDDNGDKEAGVYEEQEEDLPLKEIYQCDEDDLTNLCIRDLAAGEKNGSLGYHPDLNPLLLPPKQQ